jgi:EPS-associated MarR family transcriptional regulator
MMLSLNIEEIIVLSLSACARAIVFATLRSNYERSLIMLTDEYRYKILKMVESNPAISQRELAQQLGISLGKANFCLKALIEKGLLKATNFRNNKNKLAYMYLLTPSGIEEKASITLRFLKYKIHEYEVLQAEIEELRRDAASSEVVNESTRT